MLNAAMLNAHLDVSMPLGVVHSPQPRLALPVLGVGHEHGPSALPLGSDNTTHLFLQSKQVKGDIFSLWQYWKKYHNLSCSPIYLHFLSLNHIVRLKIRRI